MAPGSGGESPRPAPAAGCSFVWPAPSPPGGWGTPARGPRAARASGTPPSRSAARLPRACSTLTSPSLRRSHKGRGARIPAEVSRDVCIFCMLGWTQTRTAACSAPEDAGGISPWDARWAQRPRFAGALTSCSHTDLTLEVGSAVEGVT